MAGTTYSELKPEDACWLIVDEVNSPTGYWRGKVVEVDPQDGFSRVKAVITDPRQDPQSPEFIWKEHDAYLGREPSLNYCVIPSNKEFDGLVRRITGLEKTLSDERFMARTREDVLKEAIAYATRLSEDDLKALLEKK